MPGSTNTLLDEATRVVRELATNQGLAYASYGEALQRFGENRIGAAELFKAAGELYFKEAVQTAWSLVRADLNIYAGMLNLTPRRTPDAAKATPEPKPKSRGRR
jgi:hypothetical protein